MNDSIIKIDLSYLYSLTAGDKDFEKILLEGAVTDVNEKIMGLNESWQAQDAGGIKRNAHSLVSLSAIAGMPQVETWSRIIDQGISDDTFHTELTEPVNNIISGWPAAKWQLDELVAAHISTGAL